MRRWLPAALAIAVVAATFLFVLPTIADYRDVWDVVTALTWQEVAVLLAVTAVNVLTYPFPWQARSPVCDFDRRSRQPGRFGAVARDAGWWRGRARPARSGC